MPNQPRPSAGTHVVPAEGVCELSRIERRFAELPVSLAADAAVVLRAEFPSLLAAVGLDDPVPDLGPSVVVDQLRVLAWDACAAADDAGRADVVRLLTTLRRALP